MCMRDAGVQEGFACWSQVRENGLAATARQKVVQIPAISSIHVIHVAHMRDWEGHSKGIRTGMQKHKCTL